MHKNGLSSLVFSLLNLKTNKLMLYEAITINVIIIMHNADLIIKSDTMTD